MIRCNYCINEPYQCESCEEKEERYKEDREHETSEEYQGQSEAERNE